MNYLVWILVYAIGVRFGADWPVAEISAYNEFCGIPSLVSREKADRIGGKKIKICLAFSPGGHQTEMNRIMDAFDGHDIFFITARRASTENLTNVHYIRDTTGPTRLHMLFNMIITTLQSLRILLLERPNLIASTGADITIPICYLGKLLSASIIYIESIARVDDLSFGGKMIYLPADLFLVQWPRLTKKYGKAKYWGKVF